MSRKKRPERPFEPRSRARRRVLQALYQWQLNAQPAFEISRQFREVQDFDGVDAAYFDKLLAEITRDPAALDDRLKPHLQRVEGSLDQMERAILRIGACELLHHLETPYRVVIDEAIDLAHRFGSDQGHTFINAVLDRLSAECRSVERQDKPSDGRV